MDSFWKVKEAPLKEAPFLGLTGMGGGVASLMFTGAASGSGELYAWGSNGRGFSGFNNVFPAGRRSSPTQVGTDSTWKRVYASANSACGIKYDGTHWVWGTNQSGALGLNAPEPTNVSSPTQLGTGTDWEFAGAWTTGRWGVKTDGTLWKWGSNVSGGLGINQGTNTSNIFYSSPVQIPGTNWVACKTGHKNTTFAVKTDGSLWSWGYNSSRLGLNNTSPYSSPTQIPGTWATGFNSFAVGNTGTMAIKANGTLWSWGYHSDGCLGMNEGPSSWSSPRQVGTNTNWRSIHMNNDQGNRSSHGTKTDGTLWSWGGNTYGNLGLNTARTSPSSKNSMSSPTQVGTDTTWNSTSYGMQFKGGTFWTKTDGTLWFLGGLQENHGTAGANNIPPLSPYGDWRRSSPTLIGNASFYNVAAATQGGLAISGKQLYDT